MTTPTTATTPLAGRRALVMGGSSGIGAATAARFAAQGAEVVITGRDKAKLDAVASRIGPAAGTARLDATSDEQLAAFFAADTRYDLLVLALSGAAGGGAFAELELSELRAGFEAKFWAHLRSLRAALPRLTERSSVTFITAASARAALPGTAGLAAINGALEAMIPPLATELAPIRINGISPGVVDTPWWRHVPEDQRAALFAELGSTTPVGRVGTAEDIADAVVAVATNGFVTGTILEITGGAHLATGR